MKSQSKSVWDELPEDVHVKVADLIAKALSAQKPKKTIKKIPKGFIGRFIIKADGSIRGQIY